MQRLSSGRGAIRSRSERLGCPRLSALCAVQRCCSEPAWRSSRSDEGNNNNLLYSSPPRAVGTSHRTPRCRPPSPLTSHGCAPHCQQRASKSKLDSRCISDPSNSSIRPLQPVTLPSISAIPLPAPREPIALAFCARKYFEVCVPGPRSHHRGRYPSEALCLCSLDTQPQQRSFPPIFRRNFPYPSPSLLGFVLNWPFCLILSLCSVHERPALLKLFQLARRLG